MTTDEQEQTRSPLSFARVIAYCVANAGFGMFYAFNNSSLTLWLQQFTRNAALIGFLGGTHSFEGAVIQPVVGAMSDRLRSRLGRRRPIILIAAPLCCLFLCLTPLARDLPNAHSRLIAAIAGIMLFTCAFNVAMDPYQALLVDATTTAQRGRVTGIWYVIGAVGQVVILAVKGVSLTNKFYAVAAIMLVTTLITVAGTPEQAPDHAAGKPTAGMHKAIIASLIGLKSLTQARLFLLMFLVYGAATDAITPNVTIYIQRTTHCGDDSAQRAFMLLILTVAVCTIPCGWLADRFGVKPVLLLGLGLVATASLGGLWVRTLPQIDAVLILAGIGTAAQNGSSYPMLARLVPHRDIGLYTGLQSAALAVAGPASIIATGHLIQTGGYRVIFAVGFVGAVLAALLLTPIRMETGRREVEQIEAIIPV